VSPGIGMKSQRTEALDLNKVGWKPERIAAALGVDVAQVREWIYGKRRAAPTRGKPISEASPEQRAKVKGKACVRCRRPGPCDPAHLIDRSLTTIGADDALAVVPLCRDCHRAYDEEAGSSLLEVLEPHYRAELAFAVERVGLLAALFRISGNRWIEEQR
jgi:hypothetical protein